MLKGSISYANEKVVTRFQESIEIRYACSDSALQGFVLRRPRQIDAAGGQQRMRTDFLEPARPRRVSCECRPNVVVLGGSSVTQVSLSKRLAIIV
ncbi:hypothetical protein D3C81_205130 [compost metagenome]